MVMIYVSENCLRLRYVMAGLCKIIDDVSDVNVTNKYDTLTTTTQSKFKVVTSANNVFE